jgi:glyoxylase-like metal-dependent hydrolase (beta-lactamase superfamily II)
MHTITGQLQPLTPAPLPFAPATHIRSFVVPREHDNLLIYGSPTVMDDAERIRALGGVSYQYLNHWHEAMFGDDAIRDDLGARLDVHEADRAPTAERRTVDATFSERGSLGGGFEIIPTPGHTPGATAFLWDDGERRYLFTGDTIYLSRGEWVAAVLESSDRAAYLESLERLRAIEFDVLVPWGYTAGDPWFAETDCADSRRRIDAIIERVRKGGTR